MPTLTRHRDLHRLAEHVTTRYGRLDVLINNAGVTLNVAYPGHAYTSMNKGLTIDTYPPPARPIVPLLRLAMLVLFGQRAVVKASRSSIYLCHGVGEWPVSDLAVAECSRRGTPCRTTRRLARHRERSRSGH
ncbi:hypothetical protein ABNF97_02275 [Plantactinospora sp. B6F1]|uniref:hypothetical protein n=1 Tax=Plantactinospora sp. B6F1 TaxID=3158971 RepID=UPI0032D8DF9A